MGLPRKKEYETVKKSKLKRKTAKNNQQSLLAVTMESSSCGLQATATLRRPSITIENNLIVFYSAASLKLASPVFRI